MAFAKPGSKIAKAVPSIVVFAPPVTTFAEITCAKLEHWKAHATAHKIAEFAASTVSAVASKTQPTVLKTALEP